MLDFKREIKTPDEILDIDMYRTYRSFNSNKEVQAFIEEHTLDTTKGRYELGNKIVTGQEGYASVFKYDKEELETYLSENNGSIAGFNGKCYSDWLYFDLESEVNPIDMKKKVIPFLDYLNENNIEYIAFFSGKIDMLIVDVH